MMNKSIVFMFSGQGSQYYHMGKELYENHPRFKLWMDHCDEITYPLIQIPLRDILYQTDNKVLPFDRLLYSNPALIAIGYSLYRVLMEMNIQPDFVMGYSLGELSAAIVSGRLSLEDGLRFSVDFARLVEKNSPLGGMLAIIESADIMINFPELFKNCWLAGNNFQRNFVVAGLSNFIHDLHQQLTQRNIICQKLPVNYGFHTQLMTPIEQEFKQCASEYNFSSGRIPMFSVLKAQMIEEVNEDYLWQVIRYPVEFEKSIGILSQNQDAVFIDVGASGTLASFVKYLLPANSASVHLEVMNQFGRNLQSLEKLKANLVVSEAVV